MTCLLLAILPTFHLLTMLYSVVALRKEKSRALPAELPFVSVLVAARNEEENILRCLDSLARINYPADKYEVWIGDDMSDDKTAELVEDFVKDKPQFHLHKVTRSIGLAKGKANVLAQLARMAKGEIFFVTDADIATPENWIEAQLPYLHAKTVIVSGTTIVEANDTATRIQSMEWLYLMGFYHLGDKQMQITANGNNMCFRADAYFKAGGYENIPFSVTEDYALMQAMKKTGYHHRHVLEPESLCYSVPTRNVSTLLKQRNRWLSGGKDQPWYAWSMLLVYLMFFPLLMVLAFCDIKLALILLVTKLLTDLAFIYRLTRLVKTKMLWGIFLPFEIYQFIFNPVGLSYFLFKSGKVEWKGRKYNQ